MLTEEEIQGLFRGDRDVAQLLERVLNVVLEVEIANYLGAEPHEHSDGMRGWPNGHYERSLTTRVGTLRLRLPRDREGTFQTKLFQRYQRSEKALVLALVEMLVNGVSTRKVRRITDELCGREFSNSTLSEVAKGLDGQVQGTKACGWYGGASACVGERGHDADSGGLRVAVDEQFFLPPRWTIW